MTQTVSLQEESQSETLQNRALRVELLDIESMGKDKQESDSQFYTLPEFVFGITPRSDILARVVTWQRARRQQGTHKTKGQGEVRGSTRKIQKQKGTGRARRGAIRASLLRGGGICFGPVVRSHAFKLQKKVRSLGLRMALSAKAQEGNLFVFNNLNLESNKTKNFLKTFSFLEKKSALMIDGEAVDSNTKRSVANVKNYHILPSMGANVYDILAKDVLILSVDAINDLTERLAPRLSNKLEERIFELAYGDLDEESKKQFNEITDEKLNEAEV